jgi:hypothetical protein
LAERTGVQLPRPVTPELPARAPEDPEVTRIKAALLAGVPAAAGDRTEEQGARALLADLLDWHRREDKPAWWRYFYLRSLSPFELIGEPDALGGLTGGAIVGQEKKSVVRRFSFPPQEHKFSAGQTAQDAETGKGWTVWAVDDAARTIDLKIGLAYDGPWPAALVEGGPIGTAQLRERLRDLGDRVVREGVDGGDAAAALLLRRPPETGGPLVAGDEKPVQAAVRLASLLRRSYLPLQGPPGTGKTYTGAEQILALVAEGRAVGITAWSHAVIHQLIDTLCRRASGRGVALRIGQRADRDNPFLHDSATEMTNERLERALRDGEFNVAAGTVWL